MSVSIDAALADPQLLGGALGDVTTWATWMTALKAGFGIELNRQERRLFASIAGNRQPPRRKVEQLWAIAGRGSGKSRIAAAIACYIACFIEHDLDPGEVGYVLVLAGSRDQAGMVLSYAEAFLHKSPILRKMIRSVTAHEIRLTNGITIAVHTNSFRLIRGKSLLACIFDEVAFWRDDSSANPDFEVYRAVRPSLVRTHGMLIGISSPYRRTGLLYARHKDFWDADDDHVLVVQGATSVFNPTIDSATIAQEMAADPEGGRSEWQAEFRADISALLDDQVIEDSVNYARPLELPPRPNRKYFAFSDASAGRHDAFTITIAHLEGEHFIADVIRGRLAPFEPRSVAEEYALLARSYHCSKIIGDNFAGEWVANAFADAGIKYETCPVVKSSLYLESLPFFNRGLITIPNHDRLLRELRSLERRVHRSGRDSVDHPPHGSDDHANAVCGALYIAMHSIHKPKVRQGAIDASGAVTWRDTGPRDHSRITWIR